MGLFRKATSIGTLGLVHYRSNAEKTARNTQKLTKQAQQEQQLLQQQSALQERQLRVQREQAGIVDPDDPPKVEAEGWVNQQKFRVRVFLDRIVGIQWLSVKWTFPLRDADSVSLDGTVVTVRRPDGPIMIGFPRDAQRALVEIQQAIALWKRLQCR